MSGPRLPGALLQLLEVAIQLIQAVVPDLRLRIDPRGGALEWGGLETAGAPLGVLAPARRARLARAPSGASRSPAGVMANGSASSLTVASPSASRARIARRVGSARAANVLLSGSSVMMVIQPVSVVSTDWLIKPRHERAVKGFCSAPVGYDDHDDDLARIRRAGVRGPRHRLGVATRAVAARPQRRWP